MKVYIAMYWGPFTESNILGVFVNEEDAEQLAENERQKIEQEWVELWSNTEDADMLEGGPNDKTGVVEYEVL